MTRMNGFSGFGSFEQAFSKLTGYKPHGWQSWLAEQSDCRSMTIRIPTGLGKTQGVMASWAWNRLLSDQQAGFWPLRLVWCLPMRVLVEQTVSVAKAIAERLPCSNRPDVVSIMGGEDAGEWFLQPEKPAILVGTQDMLLSRALNRGYGSGRARWPMEYGLLHHDALWIMDEIQLMDVGLATSAQLQAYREQDNPKSLRPCHTWWMSATLQADWLRTVDTAERHLEWTSEPVGVNAEEQNIALWGINKSVETQEYGTQKSDAANLAKKILDEHYGIPQDSQGRITLVVCNTVKRATETYEAIRKAGRKDGIELIHSRFRPQERKRWREEFLNRTACEDADADRIIVATQVVEAGVDISANCLITELAPWPSLVQRFGRCARYGGTGRVIAVRRGEDENAALPYSVEELYSAWEAIVPINDVGIAALEQHERSLTDDARNQLYPYEPKHLLLRREFDELFDTTPDLTGADLDISRFIRSGDERDLQVFWRELGKDQSPGKQDRPRRDELCPVPFLKSQDWLCEKKKSRVRNGMRAWVWDWLDGEWKSATREALLPGRIVCVAAKCGGYSTDLGFSPESKKPVTPTPDLTPDDDPVDRADGQHDSDAMSIWPWKTIACHGREVAEEIKKIFKRLALPSELAGPMTLAGKWHDAGKAHPAFQGAIRHDDRPNRQDLAKAPADAWLQPPGTYRTADDSDSRSGFRHELASALALFAVLERYKPDHPALLGPWSAVLEAMGTSPQTGPDDESANPMSLEQAVLDLSSEQFDLLIYLVASHHGKVRVALHASPKDQDYVDRDGRGLPIRGVREGDVIQRVCLDEDDSIQPEIALTLEPAKLGLSPRTGASWRERTLGLLDRFGPATLAYLEALLRAADVRASRLETADPKLEKEGEQ